MKQNSSLRIVIAALLAVALMFVQATPAQPAPRRIDVTARRFGFTPGEITVKVNQPVVLVLTSADVTHGIRIKELGIEIRAGKGQTSEIAFTPDKTGTFIGHCCVFCGTGHGAMKMTLHVVD